MSIRGKIIQGVIWSAIQSWGSQLSSLLIFLILARLLDPEAFGLIALAGVFLALMQVFLEQGFAQALVQRETLEPEHLDTTFWVSLATGIALTALGLGIAPLYASWFRQPQLVSIIRWLSILFTISSLNNVQRALLERDFAFKAIAIRHLIGTIAGGIVGIGLALWGGGVWSLVGQQIVQEGVGTAIFWKVSAWRPRFQFSITHLRQLSNFGIHILGINFLGFFSNRADDLLIGYFLGATALGYYSVAYRILTVMTELLVGTSSRVALPAFSRLQHQPDKLRTAFYRATQLTSSIAFPIFLGTATLAPELIQVLFGEQWHPSIPVMQILSLVGLLRTVTYFKGSIFMAMGKPSWHLKINLLSAILNVLGFAIAVRWGIVAVAFAYLARACIVFPVSQTVVSKLLQAPILVYLKQFASPLLGSMIMVAAIWVARYLLNDLLSVLIQLVVYIMLGAIVYGIAIRLFAPQLFQQILDIVLAASSRTRDQPT
jgi:PST family polysaccharide transporter